MPVYPKLAAPFPNKILCAEDVYIFECFGRRRTDRCTPDYRRQSRGVT